MMLEWLAERHKDRKAAEQGARIEEAIVGLLKQDKKTKDIGGKLSTTEFTDLVAKELF